MNYFIILFATIFLVYSLKAFRFYFLLVGEGIPLFKYLRIFAITTLINIVIPFKAGEIFRIFRFGHLTKSYIKGLSIVLLDRFIDTISLLVIFASITFFEKNNFGYIFFLLSTVSVFLAVCFFVLPSILEFWNEYFLKSKSSIRHLRGLILIRQIREIYIEIKNLVKGRFFVLFTFSILSWLIEICSLLFCRSFFDFSSENVISEYLSAALTGSAFAPQRNFVMMSVLFLIVVYVFIFFVQLVKIVERKNGR